MRERIAEKSMSQILSSRLSATGLASTWESGAGSWQLLSVARRTAGELPDVRDLVFLHEPLAEPGIIGGALPCHVEDLVLRPDVLLHVAVAIETPPHLQGRLLVNQRHPIDPAVTRGAPDSLVHVNAVVEVHEVRQIVDAPPLERPILAEAGAHRFEDRRVRPDLRVAVHAGLGRRDIRERRLLYRGVAVAAVDAHRPDMMRMAELDGLIPRDPLSSHVPGPRDGHDGPGEKPKENNNGKDADLGPDVGTRM